jgi:hypothetical protein
MAGDEANGRMPDQHPALFSLVESGRIANAQSDGNAIPSRAC